MAFAPGDVVTLKSGGHSMTVVAASDDEVDCLWLSDDGELCRQSIPAIALSIIDLTDLDEAAGATEDEAEEDDEEEEDEEDGDDEEDEEEDEEEEGDEDEEEGAEKRRARRR
jgi:uncharacterized protein YodC (DUF2158 family)